MGITSTGRYGYGGEFGSGGWLNPEKFDRTKGINVNFKFLCKIIGERCKSEMEKLIEQFHTRKQIDDDEALILIDMLPR